jgi:Uma2 family endonuclease
MSTLPKSFLTPEQYLEFERASEFRHEYYNGEVVAMSGAREAHTLIAGNIFASLKAQLRGHGCRVYMVDMRVRTTASGAYTYPDVVAACGHREFLDGIRDTLLNPTVIFEVLSPSTERHDRTRKFRYYKTIDSLQQYVLVAADSASLDVFTRPVEGDWTWKNALGLEETLEIASIGCRLALSDVYEDVEFESQTGA